MSEIIITLFVVFYGIISYALGLWIGRENERLVKIYLEDWANLKGRDTCWHQSFYLKSLCKIIGVKIPNLVLPPEEDFRKACSDYADSLYRLKVVVDE